MKTQNIMFTRSVPKMSKARLFRSVLALEVVALIMHVSLPRAQAYDVSSLNGSYADSLSGFAPLSPGAPNRPVPIDAYGPVYEAGLYPFGGAGTFPARLAFNLGGGALPNPRWRPNGSRSPHRNATRTGTTLF